MHSWLVGCLVFFCTNHQLLFVGTVVTKYDGEEGEAGEK
jgi:hypothetical protein